MIDSAKSLVQWARDDLTPLIPAKIWWDASPNSKPVTLSSASSTIAFQDVYTIGWGGSTHYLNDQRYSYQERLEQLSRYFQKNADKLRTDDSLTADRSFLVDQRYNDDKLGDERYLTRRVISTKYEDFRILNWAQLADQVIASSDVDVIPDGGDLLFHPTGDNPRFIFAYDKKWTLSIENNELGGEGLWLYSEGKPEVVLFSMVPGNHIKETSITIPATHTKLYATNQYGYYQEHMANWTLPVLRGDKKHQVVLDHSKSLSAPIKNVYVVYHSHQGTDSANVSWEKLQKEFGWDRSFSDMFIQINYDDPTRAKISNTSWTHRLIDKPITKTANGETTFDVTIPEALTSKDDYFSIIFQDTHDYRYTLPFRALPDDATTDWVDEQTTPTWQYQIGEKTTTYPRMMWTLTFPRGVIEKDLQKELDDVYGEGVVTAHNQENQRSMTDETKADTEYSLEYHLPPDQSRTDTIKIKDAYGDTYSRDQSLAVKSIPKYHLKASLQWSDINLLPKDGYRWSHIQLIETNMPSIQLKFTPCTMGTDAAKVGIDETLEQRLLSCDNGGDIVTTHDFSKESQRRQETEHTIALPTQLANIDAFKVTIISDMFPGRERWRYHESYFFKTNVWLYSKIDDQNIRLRWWNLMSGDPVGDGSIELTDSAWKHTTYQVTPDGATIALTPALLASERLVAKYIPSTGSNSNSTSTLIISPTKANSVYSNDGMYGSIHSRVDPMQLYQSQPRYRGGDDSLQKLYGYTDRALYSPWDTVDFAGFTRDMSKLWRDSQQTSEFSITATIKQITAEEPLQTVEDLKLDGFGGFQWSFRLPVEAPLWTYIVDYYISAGPRAGTYEQTIQVKEFTKPTYEIRGALSTDDPISIGVDPWYYFWSPVDRYDMTVSATLIPQEGCRDCRRYADTQGGEYSNFQFGGAESTRVDRSLTDLQEPVKVPLFTRAEIPDPSATYNLVADLIVIDKRTWERLSKQFTDTITSLVQITLPGQPIEWSYGDDKLPTLSLKIADEKWLVDHTIQTWYFKPYGYATQKGVDGEMYTIHGQEMSFLSSGLVRNEIKYPKVDNEWTYLLTVQAFDNKNILLATNEKRIEYYGSTDFASYFGEIQNNSIRHVQWPSKTVEVWDDIVLDVNPYVPGTTAIITVERWNRVLDVYKRKLDGSALMIPVKELYYPNVHIGLHTVIGEQKSLVAERKEPRLLQGYTELSVNRNDTQMKIALSTDQETYEPWNKAQLKITTTDVAWKPLDARVSVAVIDKSLVDLYNIIKEPIPYFFNKMWTTVGTYTNLRFLYQMLRVYVTPGDKWWGGSDVAGRFGQNRDKFLDVAYWKADIYTQNGEATVSIDIPDNLTTRVIDAIGISKWTNLWTTTKTIVVDKKVKLSSYLPQYITIGDQITFPVTAQGRAGDAHNDLIASGTLSFEWQTHAVSFVPSSHEKDQRYGVLSLPAGMQTGEVLTVDLSISDKKSGVIHDSMTQQIPVRTKWFIQRATTLGLDMQGSVTTPLSGKIIGGQTRIYLSTFPIESRRRANEYLISYPYGCAEQKMSSLLPILLLPDLEKIGAVDEATYKNDMVKIEQWTTTTRTKRDQLITDTLRSLLSFQTDDGWFAYWNSEPKISDYGLSLSIYAGLLQASKYGYIADGSAVSKALDKVEIYLSTTPPDREQEEVDTAYLMMAWNAASAGRAVAPDQQAVVDAVRASLSASETISSKDHLNAVLLFSTLVAQGESSRAQQLMNKISWNQLSYPYTKNEIYRNNVSLHAIALQWLAALEKDIPQTKTHTDEVLLSLLKLQDKDGLRWRSTQANLQAFMWLSAFMQSRGITKPDKTISCTVTVDWIPHEMSITKDAVDVQMTIPFDATTTAVSSSWTCDSPVIIDQTVQWLPADISSIVAESKDVDLLETERDVENTTPIGMLDTLKTTFSIDNDAEQLAVEMYLPATHRFVATTSADFIAGGSIPFEVEGSYACQPNHFEVRYDRLFLYYDTMPAWTRCGISIQAIKSLTGKAGVMPTRVYEMYRARVFGNTTPLETINK